MKAWQLKRYTRLSQAEAENKPAKECQDFHERVYFWACQLAVWSPWASDVNKIVLGLSEVDRGFKF